MTEQQVNVAQFDGWLEDGGDVAALVMRQWLEPDEGRDAVIFPPTYPVDQNRAGYNIDRFEDGSSVCQIDSVGSQANRMEPIFKGEKYRHLVPQVCIRAGERQVHLLDAGHRAADAIVRFSTLGERIFKALRAYQDDGNAEPLARIAPTSIVFGSWDSRATQAKLPRMVRSVIRAYNVRELHRSAQYSTIAGEILEGGDAEVTSKGPKAELGLAHVPAVLTHGGVQVLGEIRRDAIVNLSALRAVAGSPGDDNKLKLRRYVLGLALVSITAPAESFLREGCQLVPAEGRPQEWKLVKRDGVRQEFPISHEQSLAFATEAASAFGVDTSPIVCSFAPALARDFLKLSEADRKKRLRQDPATWDFPAQSGATRTTASEAQGPA